MPYLVLKDFKGGLDNSRLPEALEDGSLVQLTNAHINSGGEIERRLSFRDISLLPADTFGLHAVAGELYVFGSLDLAAQVTGEVNYVRLQHPTGSAMTAILDTESFDGKIYAIAQYADDSIHHFYGGERVTDIDLISMVVDSAHDILDYYALHSSASSSAFNMVTGMDGSTKILTIGQNNGEPFLASMLETYHGRAITPASDGAPFSLHPILTRSERRAKARITFLSALVLDGAAVTQISVSAPDSGWTIDTLAAPKVFPSDPLSVSVINAYMEELRTLVADALGPSYIVTRGDSSAGFGAWTLRLWIEIESPPGEQFNDLKMNVTATPAAGKPNPVPGGTVMPIPFEGGEGGNGATGPATTWTLRFPSIGDGPIEDGMSWTLTVADEVRAISKRNPTVPRVCLAMRSKMHLGGGSILWFSGVNEPANFAGGIGSGFINVANQAEGSRSILALGRYLGRLAIFASDSIQVWQIDEDEFNTLPLQALNNVGTKHPLAVTELGNTDTFFVDHSGIRSLRTRQGLDLASSIDVGTPIDGDIRELLETYDGRVLSAVDPLTGRLWVVFGDTAFVLSMYPSRKISAWSKYELHASLTDLATMGGKLYARDDLRAKAWDDDSIETTTTLVQTPFMSMGKPGHIKRSFSVSIVSRGEWAITAILDPNGGSPAEVAVGTLAGTTLNTPRVSLPGETAAVSLRLASTTPGARLSQVIVHFSAENIDS